MSNATTAFINDLTSEQQTSLLSGMRRIQQRKTSEDALLTADLLDIQLRILKRYDDAERVRAMIRSISESIG